MEGAAACVEAAAPAKAAAGASTAHAAKAMVVFSLLVPQPFVWMGQNISIDLSGIPFLKENFPSFGFVNMLLCVIMFGMGMTLKADDFKYIFKKPTDVLIGICSQYVFISGCVCRRLPEYW